MSARVPTLGRGAAATVAATALIWSALIAAPIAGAAPIPRADLYVILDRSGSMATEITTIKNNLATALHELTCPPAGTGDPDVCVEDLWAGAGTMGYAGSGADAFRNWVDVQPSPSFASVPTTEPAGCCAEPMTFALHAAITGDGGADYTLSGVPPRSTCAGSPAVSAGFAAFGYPCFRSDAISVVVLATDEAPISPGDTYKPPDWDATVRAEMVARGAYVVGLVGDGAAAAVTTDLQKMAADTGAVDATNMNAPLVFSGAGAGAATALRDGIRTFIAGVPRPPPLTGNDGYTVARDTSLEVGGPGVLGNDTGHRSHPLKAAIGTPPAHGKATLDADGSFTYTPAAGFSGADAFTYTATDTVSNAGSVATVTIDVTAPSPPPSLGPPTVGPRPATAAAPASVIPAPATPRPAITVKPGVLGLSSARTCASRRSFRLRVRAPKGERLIDVTVVVDGKRAKVVTGKALAAPLKLRLPERPASVRVTATFAGGKRFVTTRRYGTCVSSHA